MDARQERLPRNEALFREVNERVNEIATLHGDDGHVFFCECSDMACTFQLRAALADYERVRMNGERFLIAPAHETIEIEIVVEKTPEWWVVEKQGEAGQLVEELDPREG